MKRVLDACWKTGAMAKQAAIGAAHKARWLVFSVCACALLLSLFALAFSGPTPSSIAAVQSAVEQLPTIAFSTAALTVSEGDGNVPVVLMLAPPSETPVTVTVSSGNIQAEASKDYEGLRRRTVIPPGTESYTLWLTLVDDTVVEGAEKLLLTLGEYQGVQAGVISETVITIIDNDIAYLSIGDVTVSEQEESVTLLITQSTISTLESLVDVRTVEGTATAPEDFEALFTTIAIPSGTTTATVAIKLNPDEFGEPTESFLVRLEDAMNAEIAKAEAVVLIIDDDLMPQIEVQPAEAAEEDGVLSFVVTLSSASQQAVTVDYETADGSAIAQEDYLPAKGTLVIPPGSTAEMVHVTLVKDKKSEPDKTLFLLLSNPKYATLTTNRVEGIIRGDGNISTGETLFFPSLIR